MLYRVFLGGGGGIVLTAAWRGSWSTHRGCGRRTDGPTAALHPCTASWRTAASPPRLPAEPQLTAELLITTPCSPTPLR